MEDTGLGFNNDDYKVFNKETYQKVLDTLEDSDARFYITADDVLHGYHAGWSDSVETTQPYGEASEVLANWTESVHVVANGKIPDGAVEVEPEELAAMFAEAINAEKPLSSVIEGHGSAFVYENERDLDRVEMVLNADYSHHLDSVGAEELRRRENFDPEDPDSGISFVGENIFQNDLAYNRIPDFGPYLQSNPVIAYFRDKYDIDFSCVVDNKLDNRELGLLGDALADEFKKTSRDVFEQNGYGEAWEYVYGDGRHPEGIGEWALQTASNIEYYKSMDELHKEITELAAKDIENIDTDEVFISGVYGQKLDDLKVGHEVAYYIDEESVQREVNLCAEYGKKAPDAGDVIEDWTDTVKTAMDGKVPEGAVEVVLDSPVNQYLDQEYKADDLPAAMDLAWAIATEKPMSEVSKEDSPLPAFCFASDKEYDRCQAMIDRAIGRNGPEGPSR